MNMLISLDRLTDWRTGRLTDWQTDGLTDWWTNGLTDWWTHGLMDWRTDGLTDWRTDRLTDWQTDRLTDWEMDKTNRLKPLCAYRCRIKKILNWTLSRHAVNCNGKFCRMPPGVANKQKAIDQYPVFSTWHGLQTQNMKLAAWGTACL